MLKAPPQKNQAHSNATYSLLLPGKVLNLSTLNTQRKFRDRGNKAGAIEAWKLLQQSGLGKMIETKARRGTDMVCSQCNLHSLVEACKDDFPYSAISLMTKNPQF